MNDMYLEHPEITTALRTGWPVEQKHYPECACCGQEMEPEDIEYSRLYEFDGEWLCGDCLKERLADLAAGELAALLGCDVMEVGR